MTELLPLSQARSLRENLGEFLTTTFSVSEPSTRQALNEFLDDPETGLFKGPYTRLRLPFAPSQDAWEQYVPTFYAALESKGEVEGPSAFRPYGHQVQAWKQLTTAGGHKPQPTLVTTGTGSGKTEAFMVPILDHCVRANEQGVTGTKAIILYPMNALANDQAARLAEQISSTPEYQGVTAAIYTGEQKSKAQRTKVSAKGLINSQDVIRSDAPDILLTNYKMLDHLLLRDADAKIWQQSADSLTYLVLDEFHAYDGAQGTDVAMLLRRLGLTLKAQAGPARADDWKTPLGPLTPVATSATMGGEDDMEAMLGFASQVLGIQLDDSAVVTETRMNWSEWSAGAREYVESEPPGRRSLRVALSPVPFATASVANATMDALRADVQAQAGTDPVAGASNGSAGTGTTADPAVGGGFDVNPGRTARIVLGHLYTYARGDGSSGVVDLSRWSYADLLSLVKAHPVFEGLQASASEASGLDALVEAVFGSELVLARQGSDSFDPVVYVSVLLTTLSHLRAVLGRQALSVDVHVWVREVSRMDRILSNDVTQFRWADDGQPGGEADGALPAIYCRACGRTGWMAGLEPTGSDLDMDDVTIRRRAAASDPRVRALIHAKAEAEAEELVGASESATYMWLLSEARSFESPDASDPADSSVAGERIPVFVDLGEDGDAHAQDDVCPSCGARDSIRFLGSAAATLLSVSMTGLLGTPTLDERERKALVFTDSVQDAAHRAGFIQARSHALTLRTAIRECLSQEFVASTNIAGDILVAADEKEDPAEARFALLPPQLEEDTAFEPFWSGSGGYTQHKATENMKRRLAFDVGLEFGLRSSVGRTLENTGTATVKLTYPDEHLLAIAKKVVRGYMTGTLAQESDDGGVDDRAGFSGSDLVLTDEDLLRWVHGTLHHMRVSGAVTHRWYDKYRDEDGNAWWLTGGRLRAEGMPGFGGRVGLPRFPISRSIRSKYPRLEPVPATKGWYGTWVGKTLGAPSSERGTLARELLEALAADGLVDTRKTESGAETYAVYSEQIWVRSLSAAEAESGAFALQCDLCGEAAYADESLTKHLVGGPCLSVRCAGVLKRLAVGANFYQNLYRDSGLLKVVAREHTSLLPDELRVKYEDEFKSSEPSPDAPNVLVATPTLEMGIDIGDLSAVMLSSLPRTVASYLQRVGRAGRLTGNSLTVAFVTARGNQLRLFQDPKATINGEVLPPATFLRALEILKRQYIASVADRLARTPQSSSSYALHPATSKQAMARGEGTYLDALAQTGAKPSVVEAFLDMFLTPGDQILPEHTKQALRDWVTPESPDAPVGKENPSGLWQRFEEAALRWELRVEELSWRANEISLRLPALEQAANAVKPSQEDQVAYRTARGSLALALKERADLTGQYWVSTMEGAGLLPNYTLLDDSVTLGVTLSWIEPETQQWQEGDFDISRGSAQALRDFAPGSTFYVRGMAIDVDAVDLGRNRDAVERWALCAECGYVKELGVSLGEDEGAGGKTLAKPPASCPRCGDTRIADAAQQLHVVKLDRVSAVMRRDKAQISDTMAERRETWFEVATAADMEPSHTHSWYVGGEDFGVRHSTSLTMRWLNLGKRMASGETHVISGSERQGPQFRVCEYCGQEDLTPDANEPKDHRPWCPRRNDLQSSTIKLSLARKLEGEGLLIRIPRSMTVGDTHSMASLMAAVHMALEMQLGRADHLAVTEGRDPSGEGVGGGILVYDTVPGGTGYLGELAALSDDGKPHSLWQILKNAYDHLNACGCAENDLLACEKCLLPYAPRSQQMSVSRQVAARLLGEILVLGQPGEKPKGDNGDEGEDAPSLELLETAGRNPWPNRTTTPPSGFTIESYLEGAFREAASAMFSEHGWNVKALPAQDGDALVLGKDRLKWRLVPQVNVGPTRPDFLLYATDPNVPRTAIYTDGRQYHFAPEGYNRVGDDSTKRAYLRDEGYRVLAVTARDVEKTQEALRSGATNPPPPKWFTRQAAEMLIQANIAELSAQSFSILGMNALDLLRYYMSSPGARAQADEMAKWLPLMFMAAPGRKEVVVGEGESLLQVTAQQLSQALSDNSVGRAEPSEGPSDATSSSAASGDRGSVAYVWVDGTLAVGVRPVSVAEPGESAPFGSLEIAVLLEDSPKYVGVATEESWRSWLHISNLLSGRVAPTTITTTSRMKEDHADEFLQAFFMPVAQPSVAAESTDSTGGETKVDADAYARWQDLFREAIDEAEEKALRVLAEQAADLPLPEVGEDGPGSIPIPIGWKKYKVALSVGLQDDYKQELVGSGWQVVDLDVGAIWEALRRRGL